MPPKTQNLEDRFWRYACPDPNTGCWHWSGVYDKRPSKGYGYIKTLGKQRLAHRVAYELFRGPIPDGLQLDHLCQEKGCVNPDHLEILTNRENSLRYRQTITHCPKGHAYDEQNTHINKVGARVCRACGRERAKDRRR